MNTRAHTRANSRADSRASSPALSRRTLLLLLSALPAAGLLPAATVALAQSEDPGDVVRDLYVVEKASLDGGPLPWDAAQRDKFFTKKLRELFALEEARTTTEGTGNLEFDPFYDGQDFDITDFAIAPAVVNHGKASVTVTFKNFDQPSELIYTLIQEGGEWRISELRAAGDEGWDLVQMLTDSP